MSLTRSSKFSIMAVVLVLSLLFTSSFAMACGGGDHPSWDADPADVINNVSITNWFASDPISTELTVSKTVAGDNQPIDNPSYSIGVYGTDEETFDLSADGNWSSDELSAGEYYVQEASFTGAEPSYCVDGGTETTDKSESFTIEETNTTLNIEVKNIKNYGNKKINANMTWVVLLDGVEIYSEDFTLKSKGATFLGDFTPTAPGDYQSVVLRWKNCTLWEKDETSVLTIAELTPVSVAITNNFNEQEKEPADEFKVKPANETGFDSMKIDYLGMWNGSMSAFGSQLEDYDLSQTVNPGQKSSGYPAGAVLKLTANAQTDYEFDGWNWAKNSNLGNPRYMVMGYSGSWDDEGNMTQGQNEVTPEVNPTLIKKPHPMFAFTGTIIPPVTTGSLEVTKIVDGIENCDRTFSLKIYDDDDFQNLVQTVDIYEGLNSISLERGTYYLQEEDPGDGWDAPIYSKQQVAIEVEQVDSVTITNTFNEVITEEEPEEDDKDDNSKGRRSNRHSSGGGAIVDSFPTPPPLPESIIVTETEPAAPAVEVVEAPAEPEPELPKTGAAPLASGIGLLLAAGGLAIRRIKK